MKQRSTLGQFKGTLDVDPGSLEGLLARAQIYEEAEDGEPQLEHAGPHVALNPDEWEKLTQLLKHQLDSFDDPQNKLLAIRHVAVIYEYELEDPQRCLRWWGQVLTKQPFDDPACRELERLAAKLDAWRTLVQVYGTASSHAEPPARKQLQLRLARVYLDELKDEAQGERVFRALLARHRDDPETLQVMERYYQRAGRHEDLIEVLRRQLAAAETTEEQTELRLRLGYTFELELEDPDLAAESYRSVLRDDPHNRQALEALEQIYLRQERWRELVFTYERMVAAAERDSDRVDLLMRMANIYDDAHVDRERSQQIWGRVLELRGEDPDVLNQMSRRFKSMERWGELADVLARRAGLEQDPTARARLLEEQGRTLADRAGEAAAAVSCFEAVVSLEQGNTDALQRLADLHGALGQTAEQSDALGRLIAIGETEGMSHEFLKGLYQQLARLESEVLERPDAAIEAWFQVLRLDPDDPRPYDAIEPLLCQRDRWADAVQVLELKEELVEDDDARAEVLRRIAEIQRDGLGDAEAALRSFSKVRALCPDDEDAFDALRRLYQQLERHAELVELNFAWLELIDDPRRAVELLQEAALIYEEQLEQPDKAFAVWLSAFRQDRMNDDTRIHLERLATAAERWSELLDAFAEAVKETTEARVKVSLLTAMGRWYVGLEQPELASSLVNQALHMDPEHVPALEVLGRCLRALDRHNELVPVLRRNAELERDPERVVTLLCEVAELWQTRLGDPEQAIATYERSLQVCPAEAAVLSAPLAALGALYREHGRLEPLIEVLERQVARTDEAERLVSLKLQVGEAWRRLLEPTKAIAAYKEVLALDPHDKEAMEALQALYDTVGESEAYLDILEQQIDHAEAPTERVAMYPRIAAAWREQFERTDRAVACLEKLLELDETQLEAYVNLEQLYRERGDFELLVRTYERHIAACAPAVKVALYLELGSLFRGQLGDTERAIAAFVAALNIDAEQVEALEALAGLHERSEAWEPALAALARLARLAHDPSRAAELSFRVGKINEDNLDRPDEAEARYQQALEEDGGHFGAMERLVGIHRARQQWRKAAGMMVRAEANTDNELKRAQLLHEAGLVYLEQLDDEPRGVELLDRTLAIDPEHVGAALPLARFYYREQAWERLEPILDMLARKVPLREKQTRHSVCFWLGRTAAELGNLDKAVRCFKEARAIDATHLPTLQCLADLQYRTSDWPEAFKTYQTILVHHREALKPVEVVRTFHQLGRVKAEQGERRKALSYFDKALEENPRHRGALEAVIELQTEAGQWRAVTAAKQALLGVVDEDERFTLLVECGDLFAERLQVPDEAIESYKAAVTLRPEDRVLLHRLLELLTAQQRWDDALRAMLRIAALEPAPALRARYFYTAGILCRDEMGDAERALDLFNQTLDCAPDQLKAFEAVDRMLTARKDWAGLERSYRKMIQRLPDQATEPKLAAMLWHNLGEVYRTRMKRRDDAIVAFEQAVTLQPQNDQGHEILAELYELCGAQGLDKAVGEHQTLLRRAPLRLESLQALRRLYAAAGQPDSAFCVAAALRLLGKAGGEEQQLYQQRWQRQPRRAAARITDALWGEQILHRSQDLRIGALLAAVAPTLMELTARPAKEFGLKKKLRVKPGNHPVLTQQVDYIASVLGVASPDLYAKRDQQADLMVANTAGGASVIVGERLLNLHSEKELAFTIAQQLTFLRPGLFLSLIFPSPAQLRTVLLAALRLCTPQLPIPAVDAVEVDRLVQRLSEPVQMNPGLLQRLTALAQPLVEQAAGLDLGRWLAAAGLTAHRMGLILCDDLEVASRIIRAEPSPFGMMPASGKIKELVAYSVSPAFFEVRRVLGLRGVS